jgi:dihydropyrimidinase
MPLLIRNGEIVTPNERYVADIFCEGEMITRIDREIPAPNNRAAVCATAL